MNTTTYEAFSDRLHRTAVSRQLPLNGSFEITHRCPLTCAHCYNNLPMTDTSARDRELTRDEHYRLLDELVEAGCLWLLYTGGEIFARRDFLDIYTRAKQNGFITTLFTNGTLITPRIADYLSAWRPFAIEITLYGRTRETYERLTGIPGSFDRCMRGIDLLLERGLPLALKTVAVSINRHEIWAMQSFADDLGVDFKFDGAMNPRIDCSQSPLAVRLSPEEVVAFDLEDPHRLNEWERFAEQNFKTANPPERQDELYYCGGGVDSFSIDPYGRMSICVLSQQDKFDLRTGSLRDGWEVFLRAVRRRKITRPTKCIDCELKTMCGMCPANGELENGDPEAPVDFLCRVAHLRAHAFDLPFGRHGDCEYCEGGVAHDEIVRSAAALKQLPRHQTSPRTADAANASALRRRHLCERRVPELQLTLKTGASVNSESDSKPIGKRAYQRPEVTEVQLKPEEAVLAVCKTPGRSGSVQARCSSPAPCSSNGS